MPSCARGLRAADSLGQNSSRRQLIGHDPIDLLGHAPVERSQAGFDVRDRHVQLRGRERAGERRVGVAVDQHPVRPFSAIAVFDADQHRAVCCAVLIRNRRRARYSGFGMSSSRKEPSDIASS